MAATQKSRGKLSRSRILRAALGLADRKGIEKVSMRKIAEALKVEAMSLYTHVKNKEDVLDGIVDLVVAKIELPTRDGDWKREMRRRAISAHEVLLEHPWAATLFHSRMNIGPAMLRYIDATIGCLHAGGFSYSLADKAWNVIDSHIYGFTLQEINFPFQPGEYAEAATEFLPQIPKSKYSSLFGLTQEIIQGSHDGVQDFCFGLDLLLDGLERQLENR